MLLLTEKMKEWLVKECGVDATADDVAFRKAAGEAFAEGTLTAAKYLELTKDAVDVPANAFQKKLDSIADSLGKLVDAQSKAAVADEKKIDEKKIDERADKKLEEKKVGNIDRLITSIGQAMIDDKSMDVRVKDAAEQYDGAKSAAVYPEHTKSGKSHPFAGRPIMDFSEKGRPMDAPSQRDKAVCGAWAKFLCSTAQSRGSKTLGFQRLAQHDKELVLYALENMEWSGSTNGDDYADIKNRRLTPNEQKALIDDAVSGAVEAAPIVFDDQVIATPLLYGELFPLVNTVPIPRGRRVEGVAVGQVTGSWGGVDDTAISLFNTASYVSAFDTTIYRWEGAIRIGLDFLGDTPLNFNQIVTQQYGEALLNDLDDVVATGNGTTQPEGVMTKSGTTSVAFGGTTSIGNYESLLFGVGKAELRPNVASSAVFCGTETSYARVKALPIGAGDARRLFGEGGMGTGGYRNYSVMGQPYKINSSMTNAQLFYAVLARYRMYRREGLTMRSSTEGDTLIRNNELLMVGTARYGGQLERGACAAITTTAPV